MRFSHNNVSLFIDDRLATQLNTIAYNLKKDYDFVIIVSGDRTVRVGKSVLAMTICSYLAHILPTFGMKTKYDADNIYFDNQKMLDEAPSLPKNSILHYDEGREGLAATKHMRAFQQDLLDFFAECGQLNHVFVVVLPDFFQLKEEIAVPRSEFLINVYRTSEPKIYNVPEGYNSDNKKLPIVKFNRGQFQFFSRRRKGWLYDKFRTTRQKSYNSVTHNFVGRFNNQYPIPEEEYRKKKLEALKRFKEKKEEALKKNKDTRFRDQWIINLRNSKVPVKKIKELLESQFGEDITLTQIYNILKKYKKTAPLIQPPMF